MHVSSRHTLSLLCLPLLFLGMVFVGCDSQNPLPSDRRPSPQADDDGPSPAAKSSSGRTFAVEQGDNCFDVTPLSTGELVETFYDYRQLRSHTGLEVSDVSNLFLFQGPRELSLVVIHDKPEDGSGGAASLDFTGLPTGSGQWVVQDDDGDFSSNTDSSPDWFWVRNPNDGGAWRGGLDGSFTVTIDPAFNEDAEEWRRRGRIDEWHFLSGDATNPERTNLDLETPVTIRTGTCAIEVDIDVKPGSDPNAVNPNSKGLITVAILHTDDFDPVARADVSTLRFDDPDDVDDNGAEPAHQGHAEDVDQDGDDDLVLHFPTGETHFDGDETDGKLVGTTNDGTPLFGTDTVKLVGGGTGGPPTSPGPSGPAGSPGRGPSR